MFHSRRSTLSHVPFPTPHSVPCSIPAALLCPMFHSLHSILSHVPFPKLHSVPCSIPYSPLCACSIPYSPLCPCSIPYAPFCPMFHSLRPILSHVPFLTLHSVPYFIPHAPFYPIFHSLHSTLSHVPFPTLHVPVLLCPSSPSVTFAPRPGLLSCWFHSRPSSATCPRASRSGFMSVFGTSCDGELVGINMSFTVYCYESTRSSHKNCIPAPRSFPIFTFQTAVMIV